MLDRLNQDKAQEIYSTMPDGGIDTIVQHIFKHVKFHSYGRLHAKIERLLGDANEVALTVDTVKTIIDFERAEDRPVMAWWKDHDVNNWEDLLPYLQVAKARLLDSEFKLEHNMEDLRAFVKRKNSSVTNMSLTLCRQLLIDGPLGHMTGLPILAEFQLPTDCEATRDRWPSSMGSSDCSHHR